VQCGEGCTAREKQERSTGYSQVLYWLTRALSLSIVLIYTLMTALDPFFTTTTYVPKSKRSAFTGFWIFIKAQLGWWFNEGFHKLEVLMDAFETKNYRARRKVKCRAGTTPSHRRTLRLPRAALLLFALTATDLNAQAHEAEAVFDTDSALIRVDNCATACISNDTKDFIGELTPSRRKVKGIVGPAGDGVMTGTIQWHIEDDDGVSHEVNLPGSYYVPWSTSKLLSPQHWAQTAKDNKPMPRGTWCAPPTTTRSYWSGNSDASNEH